MVVDLDHLHITDLSHLRRPIDWDATPGRRRRRSWYRLNRENIIQHWRRHITGWLGSGDQHVYFVSYENLVEEPTRVISGVSDFFGIDLTGPTRSQGIQVSDVLVGFSPNQGWVCSLAECIL